MAEAGVFAPTLIHEVDLTVRERSPYQAGKCINEGEFVLHGGPFLAALHETKGAPSQSESPLYFGIGSP